MSVLTRRQFTKSVAACVTAPAFITSLRPVQKLPIAFSTLGCPKWNWKTILEQAHKHGYSALEMRGLLDEMDLTKSAQFTGAKLAESLKDLDALGLKISDLGASSRFGEPDNDKRAAQLEEAKRFIDLAHKLKSPYVRIFGGKLAQGQTMKDATSRIIDGFHHLHGHAKAADVTLLIESHDEFTTSESLLAILKGANLPTAALLWDAHHTFVTGNESPEVTFKNLGRYTKHTHLKDSSPPRSEEPGRRYVLTGTGEVPVRDTVRVLVAGGYKGYYCFEWEKRWHPEIEDPETAIPHFADVIREYLADAGVKSG